MTYTVEWLPSAERELADLWNNAADRAATTAAANSLDAALQRHPSRLGESRGGTNRIAFEKPLTILFDIDEANKHVRVWDIWRWPSR